MSWRSAFGQCLARRDFYSGDKITNRACGKSQLSEAMESDSVISWVSAKRCRRSRVRVCRSADRRKMLSGSVRVKVRVTEQETATAARPRTFSAPFNPTSRNLQPRKEAGERKREESRVNQNFGIKMNVGGQRSGLAPEGEKRYRKQLKHSFPYSGPGNLIFLRWSHAFEQSRKNPPITRIHRITSYSQEEFFRWYETVVLFVPFRFGIALNCALILHGYTRSRIIFFIGICGNGPEKGIVMESV